MKKRMLCLILAVIMVLGLLPTMALADATPQVRVIVENTTYTAPEAAWTGTLVDKWVEFKNDSTMMSCLLDALGEYTQEGADSNYITEIDGLAAGNGGEMSGWMGSLNDWFASEGFDAFTAASGKLKAGDEIRIMYTCDFGEDLGSSWNNNDKTVKGVAFSAGILNKTFDKDESEYTLTVAADVTAVTVTPTASNKNFQVRTSVGSTEYQRSAAVPVEDGTVITVKCGDPEWPSMNNSPYGTADSVNAETYTFTVVKEQPQPVTVTVNAAPSTVSVSFFADAAAETAVDGSAITDNGVVKVGSANFHQYVLSVVPGTYSYRGTDGDYVLGGEQFTVTEDTAQTLNLLRANIRYNGSSLNQEGDYSFTFKNGENDVACGTPYVTSSIRYTPTLLIANVKHEGTVTLAEKWQDDYYLTNSGAFSTTPSKTATSAATVNLPISQYKIIKVTAPTAATTTFYKQDANYVVESVTPDSTAKNAEAGTTTYIFKGTAAHSNYQFRSMMAGKMTQAGYLADGNDITVSFSDEQNPYSTASTLTYDDNSVLLNVSAKNKLSMGIGETFKLRAFRAAWEIINTTTGNQMIEPDFHYAILSGYDVVSIAPTTECTNSKFPNAKNGNASGNWMNITALKKGTAVVAVWYDAINVFNANPPAANDWSVFGATAPERYGVFVVSVGDDSSITWNPASHDGDWDAEFDTVYYNGDAGCFTFAPTEDVTSVTVQNVYGTALGTAQTVEASADGSYAVPVTTGANIIAVTTADGTDYQIVRAKQISYTITNNTTGESEVNGAPAISTEDSVTISFFDKLDMPIPKMSGIYNPGYMGTAKTAYELNGSLLLTSAGTQYDFSTNNSITFIAHVAGENSLKGYISLSSMGDPFGNHRGITDDGKPVNTNAGEVFGDFGVLPDISFTVTDNGEEAKYTDATKITKFSVLAGLSTYNMAFNWNEAKDTVSAWNKTAQQVSTFGLIANVTAKDYNNVITFRYWYDGEDEEVHSVQLKSGIATTISNTDFPLNPEKILHLQVEIKPLDESLGDPITYNYLAFPGSSNLSYVHPFLKSLTAKNGGETLVMKPVLNTADTAYTLCVGDAENITLSGEQLIQIYNPATTADKSDSVVLTKMKKDGSPVGDSITILEAGVPTNPNRYWACDELDITDADALRIVVTSYVDNTTARTYTFTLDRIAGSANEKEAQAVDALINDIGEVSLESEAKIIAAREAYNALTPEQQALVTKLGTLTDAESALAELKNPPLPPIIDDDDDTITVTFRLIGSTKASSDVDLSKGTEGYNGAEYVTWIETTAYTLEKGATVGDLFAMALDEAGLDYVGLENNYISAITAPEACGGYLLAEMDNGLNSGWMYTINGSHPGSGLNDRQLSNGDRVIWHYVDDYAYEVKDWPDGSSGDSSVWNKWLTAADVTPEAQPEPTDPVKPDEESKQEDDKACFVDVPEDEYYTDAVDWAVENGITKGTDDTHFSPDDPCDRAQTVTFLWRAAGCPEPKGTENPFTDLDETAYYYKAVLWAVENGITNGTSETTFSPEKTVTRAQVVTFLCRFAKGSSDGDNPFTDVKNGEYYAEAVNWAVENEVTNGTSATTFSPDDDCVRAQIVTFLYRCFA